MLIIGSFRWTAGEATPEAYESSPAQSASWNVIAWLSALDQDTSVEPVKHGWSWHDVT
jgi:hypothetical protein